MSLPFVSIIIPYYNSIQSIERAIDSVLNQSSKDWELIVVDDGSSELKAKISKKYSNDKIKFFEKKNTGPSDSRNYGVQNSSGKYLSFLDSDDWLNLTWVNDFKQVLKKDEFDLAYCYGAIIDENTKEKIEWRRFHSFLFERSTLFFNHLVSTFVVRRDLFIAVDGFDKNIRYGENMDLAIRILSFNKGLKLAYVDSVLVNFGNYLDIKKRNSKYSRSLMLKDLSYFQEKHFLFLKENKSYLRGLIRKQIVSAVICKKYKTLFFKLKDLFFLSVKDFLKYLLLVMIFPLYRKRLLNLGFRE